MVQNETYRKNNIRNNIFKNKQGTIETTVRLSSWFRSNSSAMASSPSFKVSAESSATVATISPGGDAFGGQGLGTDAFAPSAGGDALGTDAGKGGQALVTAALGGGGGGMADCFGMLASTSPLGDADALEGRGLASGVNSFLGVGVLKESSFFLPSSACQFLVLVLPILCFLSSRLITIIQAKSFGT